MGRKDDFLYNDQGEKINLGNISNCTKSVLGVIKFQVVQNEIGEIIVNLIPDQNFNSVQLKKFLDNLHMRFGAETNIQLNKVSDIPLTKSGKFRFILNNVSVR
jgi:phenylacetate-CoA ligase